MLEHIFHQCLNRGYKAPKTIRRGAHNNTVMANATDSGGESVMVINHVGKQVIS